MRHIYILSIGAFIGVLWSCSQLSGNNIEPVEKVGAGLVRTNAHHDFCVKPLITTRFTSLEHLKEKVNFTYLGDTEDTSKRANQQVILAYKSNGQVLLSELSSGTDQDDILSAKDGGIWDKTQLLLESPYSIRSRAHLAEIYMMARRRHHIYGEGDVAFYDLAEAAVDKVSSPDLAYLTPLDSSDKGLVNTFNHVTAQALITSFFSKDIADFIADAHERKYMPELTSGRFTLEQLEDSLNHPVDNYVDIINNEVGQQLGLHLRDKYRINRNTRCTPELLSAYLNDLQSYYAWSLEIGLRPFQPTEEVLIRFSNKINSVLDGI